MSDDLQVKGGVVGASAPTAPTALSSADADQAASRLAPPGLQSTGAETTMFTIAQPRMIGTIASDGKVSWPEDIGPADIIGHAFMDGSMKIAVLALWYATHPASVDTHAKRGDAAQTAAPFMSGAVPAEEQADAPPSPSNEPEHD